MSRRTTRSMRRCSGVSPVVSSRAAIVSRPAWLSTPTPSARCSPSPPEQELPESSGSPTALAIGSDSPVSRDSSASRRPSTSGPSTTICPPLRSRTRSPTTTSDGRDRPVRAVAHHRHGLAREELQPVELALGAQLLERREGRVDDAETHADQRVAVAPEREQREPDDEERVVVEREDRRAQDARGGAPGAGDRGVRLPLPRELARPGVGEALEGRRRHRSVSPVARTRAMIPAGPGAELKAPRSAGLQGPAPLRGHLRAQALGVHALGVEQALHADAAQLADDGDGDGVRVRVGTDVARGDAGLDVLAEVGAEAAVALAEGRRRARRPSRPRPRAAGRRGWRCRGR